jgi:3-hydroxyisobutyrate dehydrogenase
VGVIGVGNMGGAMAERLRALGHAVMVRDVGSEAQAALAARGASVAPSPAAVAAQTEFIVVAVVDAAQNASVLFDDPQAAIQTLDARHTVVLTSTIAPHDVEAFAQRLKAQGVAVIDAPVSGGPHRAREGTMTMMVAATDADTERARPLLAALSSQVVRVGGAPGQGAAMKRVNNTLAAVNLAAAGEACALAARAGIDPATVARVVGASSGQSWIFDDRIRRVLLGDAVPRAHLGLLAKDSALATAMAAGLGVRNEFGALAAARFAEAVARGLGSADDSVLLGKP